MTLANKWSGNGTGDGPFNTDSTKCVVFEDFFGTIAMADQGTPGESPWVIKDTSSSGSPTKSVTDLRDGKLTMKFSNTSEEQILTLYWNDILNMGITKNPVVIFRLALDDTPDSVDIVKWGLGSARNDTEDSVATNAWFSIAGASLVPKLESDDGTTDNDDGTVTKGSLTMVAGTYYEFMIDCDDLTDVKFYHRENIGGSWTRMYVSGVTHNISAATGGVQPIIQIHKASSTGTTGILIDYVKCYWDRTA